MFLSSVVAAAIGITAGFMIWHGRQSALEDHRAALNSMDFQDQADLARRRG
jgi:hypothetical protein